MSDGPPGITSRAPAVQPSWRRDSNTQPADYKSATLYSPVCPASKGKSLLVPVILPFSPCKLIVD